MRKTIGIICAATLLAATYGLMAEPVVPGFDRLAGAEGIGLADRGELLLGELNCVSCHSGEASRVETKPTPNLDKIGERVTPQYLRQFLSGTHAAKPGTTMPDVFHASEAAARDGAVDYLVHFLVSRGGPIANSQTAINPSAAERGHELFHQVGCIACHAPEVSAGITTPMVPLPQLARKTTVEQLTKFLLDPLHVRPGGRMPNLHLQEEEAHAIAMYLVKEQMDNPQIEASDRMTVNGLRYEYFEGGWNKLPDFDKLTPVSTGIADEVSLKLPAIQKQDGFALRFRGNLNLKRGGKIRFWLASDDGSRLIVNGQRVLDNDGIHPRNEKKGELDLEAGSHTIEVQYFEGGGQEVLDFQIAGSGMKKGEWNKEMFTVPNVTPMIPLDYQEFTVDPQKARMGAQMFSALRCASCHNVDDMKPMRPAKSLASLNVSASDGCLGGNIRKGVPNYQLSDDQRAALKAALDRRGELNQPLQGEAWVQRKFASLNCYACHERGGIGRPDDTRAALFQTTFEIDLGEEGTIPPRLNSPGAKLQTAALHSILKEQDLHVRHYMATRMPAFGEDNLKGLVEKLIELDRQPKHVKKPEFSEESMAVGHKFVGIMGLSCVACHNVNGSKAVGIPGIDLVSVQKRINPGWFKDFLLDPTKVNPGTRMPAFWPGGQSVFPDILAGNSEKQIEAIWNYFSLGDSMPRPAGMTAPGGVGEEIIVDDRPILHRTFMTDVGPRSILAGFPERVHVAFDANVVRLAKAWRGRFFDGSGVTSGRSDKFLGPLGTDVIDLPAGPAFAQIGSETTPWPKAEKTDRNIGGQFQGYRLDEAGRPTFLYEQDGYNVAESIVPVLQPGGSIVVRSFEVTSDQEGDGFYFLAATGKSIEKQGDGWVVDGKQTLTLESESGLEARVRDMDGEKQLLVPVYLKDGKATFNVTISW